MKIHLGYYLVIHPAAVEYRAFVPILMTYPEEVMKTAINEPRNKGGRTVDRIAVSPLQTRKKALHEQRTLGLLSGKSRIENEGEFAVSSPKFVLWTRLG